LSQVQFVCTWTQTITAKLSAELRKLQSLSVAQEKAINHFCKAEYIKDCYCSVYEEHGLPLRRKF